MKEEIEKIEYEGTTLAIVLRSGIDAYGTQFITHPSNPLQVAVLGCPEGEEIKPHAHPHISKRVSNLQEFLFVTRGVIRVNFYDARGKETTHTDLFAGDSILLLFGGHGLRAITDSRIIEVKQGPYLGIDNDKVLIK